MNSSERIAYEYLKKRFADCCVFKETCTPDFKVMKVKEKWDNIKEMYETVAEFEVKQSRNGQILFTDGQVRRMKPADWVIVVEDGRVADVFLWGDRDNTKWKIKDYTIETVPVRLRIKHLDFLKSIDSDPNVAIALLKRVYEGNHLTAIKKTVSDSIKQYLGK